MAIIPKIPRIGIPINKMSEMPESPMQADKPKKWFLWRGNLKPTTCAACAAHIGKIYCEEELESIQLPPLHPNCGCEVVPLPFMNELLAELIEKVLERKEKQTQQTTLSGYDERMRSMQEGQAVEAEKERLKKQRQDRQERNLQRKIDNAIVYADTKSLYNLSTYEMAANADYIRLYLTKEGWSLEAICALLGNIEQESQFNPAAWEENNKPISEKGYGLVQWTPATKFFTYIGLESMNAGINEVARIAEEDPKKLIDLQLEFLIVSSQPGGGEWLTNLAIGYGAKEKMKFEDFVKSTESPAYLCEIFHAHYERSNDLESVIQKRKDFAEEWYRYFTKQQ